MKDIVAVIGFAVLIYFIDFNKEAIKALITGAVIGYYLCRRLK
ncbi:hypothetical protein [Veillonella sp.]|nr:hypothetical protein [Veillonella sp.]